MWARRGRSGSMTPNIAVTGLFLQMPLFLEGARRTHTRGPDLEGLGSAARALSAVRLCVCRPPPPPPRPLRWMRLETEERSWERSAVRLRLMLESPCSHGIKYILKKNKVNKKDKQENSSARQLMQGKWDAQWQEQQLRPQQTSPEAAC